MTLKNGPESPFKQATIAEIRHLPKRRIADSRLGEACRPQEAGIAMPAGSARCVRVVATEGQAVVDVQRDAPPDDVRLGQVDERGVDRDPPPFDPHLRGEVGGVLERADELGTAIRPDRQ